MQWYRPHKLIKEEIQEPIKGIGAIAVVALTIAVIALFIALGKE
jgi:hypothetical protein